MKRLLPFLFGCCVLPAFSQQQFKGAFRINYDNDFFSATDYYYTQGIRFEFSSPAIKKISPRTLLLHVKGGNDTFGLTLNQLCYTPTSIRRDTVFTGDHPFAGAIFLGWNRSSSNDSTGEEMYSEVDAGGIGPCAHCKETQENIHKWLHNIQPLGWQFQVGNDIVLNYFFHYDRKIFRERYFDASFFTDVKAGTLFDGAGLGNKMRLGILRPSGKFHGYVFSTAEVYGVGYNAVLEGGVFREQNIYTIAPQKLERVLLDTSIGLVLYYRKMSVEYTKHFISPEFHHGLEHSWGHCVLGFYF